MRGDSPKWNLFIKNYVFILTCLNFSHLQSILSIWYHTLIEVLFPLLKNSFWTFRFWCLLVLLPFFVSPLPHWQNVSLWGLFSSGETKIICSGWDWVNREGGAMTFFGQILLNIQHSVGRCTHKSPITRWANTLKVSSEKFIEAEHGLSQHHQLVHWYKWVPRTLT